MSGRFAFFLLVLGFCEMLLVLDSTHLSELALITVFIKLSQKALKFQRFEAENPPPPAGPQSKFIPGDTFSHLYCII